MSATGRISLGAAFLTKTTSAGTSSKCIIHAEFVLQTKQYILTKITYAHDAHFTLGLKSSETICKDIVEILSLLTKKVAAKTEKGYVFDEAAMELLSEVDESWEGFELLGTSDDDELTLSFGNVELQYPQQRIRRMKLDKKENRRTTPTDANRAKRMMLSRSVVQKTRLR